MHTTCGRLPLRGGTPARASLGGFAQNIVSGLQMTGGLVTSGLVVGFANVLGLVITLSTNTHKVTDLLGSGAFAAAALACKAIGGGGGQRALISTVIITAWSVRLAGFLFYRILNTSTDDRLGQQFKTKHQTMIFWTASALWGWICLIPHSVLCFNPNAVAMGPMGWGAAALAAAGLLAEAVADQQKWAFKQSPESKTTWCTRGLWRYSRHPNYCGELVVWLGLYLLTLPTLGSLPSLVGCAASPAFITLLLLKVSGIPLAEQRMDEKFSGNSEYQDYKASTPVLFPVPW